MIGCVTLQSLLPSLGLVSMFVQDVLETHTQDPHNLQASPTLGPHPGKLLEPYQEDGGPAYARISPLLPSPSLSPSCSFFSLFSMTFIKGKQHDP